MSSELVSSVFLVSSFSFAYSLERDHDYATFWVFLLLPILFLPTRIPRSDVFARLTWLYVNVQTNQLFMQPILFVAFDVLRRCTFVWCLITVRGVQTPVHVITFFFHLLFSRL